MGETGGTAGNAAEGRPIRVLVAAETQGAREALRATVAAAPRVSDVLEAASGEEVISVVGDPDAAPDVVVLDAALGREEDEVVGEFPRELKETPGVRNGVTPAVVLALADDPGVDAGTLHAISRADGYVDMRRPDAPEKLRQAVRLAAAGTRARFEYGGADASGADPGPEGR